MKYSHYKKNALRSLLMKYRKLGKTGLEVSEIAFGAEWLQGKTLEESKELIDYCHNEGINFLDCWMSEPNVRTNIGMAIKDTRDDWIIQGHFGSTWQDEQYVRTREMDKVIPAFEDFMERLQLDFLDFGMIHFVDEVEDFEDIMNGEFIEYVRKQKEEGVIKHIGISTHSPTVALLATEVEDIELIMFSINPAFDMMGSINNIEIYIEDDTYKDKELEGLAPERAELYQICKEKDIPLVVMKGYAGGRLLSDEDSPFGAALTPVQCIEYCLSRPAVASIFVGVQNVEEMEEAIAYETASIKEKDYASVLVNAPKNSYEGQCTYCGHCAPCTENINIAMVNKYYDLARHHDEVPESIKSHHNDLTYNSFDCISCGSCEGRCPFNVKIVEIMENARKLFQ